MHKRRLTPRQVLDCADHVEQGFMEQLEAEQAEAEDELKKDECKGPVIQITVGYGL